MDKIVLVPSVGPEPERVICPSCQSKVMTKTEQRSNTRTHMYALMLFLLMCWPCVFLPYCADSCRDTVHKCPVCNAYIGVYKR